MSQNGQTIDHHWMAQALDLAAKGQGLVEPNPMVGCVLVKDGRLIGEGFHRKFGQAHAEVEALRSLSDSSLAHGATAYVTLEPCCHHGKTPPCSDALIDAGVSKVVIAMRDPFPKVDGGGIGRLTEAGIEVTLGVGEAEAGRLNAPYLKRLRTGRPWVIAKWAMTADGRIATVEGESQWISGPASRHEVHRLRGRVDAILAGMGTIQTDDPMLNARLGDTPDAERPARVAERVVFCRNRTPPLHSKLVRTAREIPTRLFVSPRIDAAARHPLTEAGLIVVPLKTDDHRGMIEDALDHLGSQDMTNVMVEGGGMLLGSFLTEGVDGPLIDECQLFIGPKLFGGTSAPGPIGGAGIGRLAQAPEMKLIRMDAFGDDVRLIYHRRES